MVESSKLPISLNGVLVARMLPDPLKSRFYHSALGAAKELDLVVNGKTAPIPFCKDLVSLFSSESERKKEVNIRLAEKNYSPIVISFVYDALRESGFVRPIGVTLEWQVIRTLDVFARELSAPEVLSDQERAVLKTSCYKLRDYLIAP